MQRLAALIITASLFGAGTALAHEHGHRAPQTDWSKVEIKTEKVAGSVHMLQGAGGNIGVTSGPDGLLIVDDQYAPVAEKIRAALKQLNSGRLKFVLNTHWHGDHTGGNAAFGRESTIIAHENVRKRLAVRSRVMGNFVPPSPPEALPVVTFDESVRLHFNGEQINVVHFPAGHTDGDSIIFFTGSNVIHMGDHFFTGRFPFVDLENGGSVEGLTRNVAEVIAKAPAGVKFIPGHGPVSTVEDLKTYHGMLVETTAIVRAAIKAGKTVEQVKAEGLPEKWKEWGTGFIKTDRWLETIYQSLTRDGEKRAAALLGVRDFQEAVFARPAARAEFKVRRIDEEL
jgi:glyoxylase-like metal-dependent hydrolase (beta-lactamase superfamily II)